ncbi:hypothetical protein [Sphaerisporangium sp. TRM90804]|uniref:hypothetical protein n=1 Tax=Sphaerisporangium sp. TRM90804 TaxID=3031113 RepID=UPI00244D0D89|nr:hypothetical protein [Sphaerisporangium sp. TRM90804]MDH2426083.1 hypothetical protein [Sphaerisporangium sp. TRM90804]
MLARVRADPAVVGVVLSGSRARDGMAVPGSDYDVYLVTADGETVEEDRRDASLDVAAMPLEEFRAHALPGSGAEWNRYAFTHARVLEDRADGLIGELVSRKGALSAEEARQTAATSLDAFVNGVYRWLKNERNGRVAEAHLDAAESIPPLLTCVFALHGRVRPYNAYLGWELRNHPLGPPWGHERVLPLLRAVLSHAEPRTARRLFLDLEPLARAAGHGPVLDAWGDDLRLLRG